MVKKRTDATGVASAAPVAQYVARGWRVLPLRGKVPLAGTNGVHSATTDVGAIEDWPAGVNVGIACGDGLLVLDVDHAHDGGESLHELERRHGELPLTASVATGGGGSHFYFTTARRLGCSVGTLGRGLDTRGEGGFVVAPPSIHPGTGRRYEWDNDPAEVALAPVPRWLERLLRTPSAGHAQPASSWRALARDGATEGTRNVCTARLAGHLLARGIDPYVALELLVAWDQRNRPPLGRGEVTRTVDSIAAKEARKWAA